MMMPLALLSVFLLLVVSDARAETAEAVDFRWAPVVEHWVSELKSDFPIFYSRKVPSVGELPGLHAPFTVSSQTPLMIAPQHIRLRKDESGRPLIRVHRHLFTRNVEIEAEFELGIFGEALDNLSQVLSKYRVPNDMIKINRIQLTPVDSGWMEELRVSLDQQDQFEQMSSNAEEASSTSFYNSFREIESELIAAPSLADGVVWRGKFWMSLSAAGRSLLKRSLRNGMFSFPLVARVKIAAITNLDSNEIEMVIPGGLACLRRDFWGKTKQRRLSNCEHYWDDQALATSEVKDIE